MADETTVTKNLWTEHMGKGFAAKQSDYAIRASEDVDGNRIDTTYATKTELGSKQDTISFDGIYDPVNNKAATLNSIPALTTKTYRIPDEYDMVHIGGRGYKIITIGSQLWMAENLDWKFPGCEMKPDGVPTTPAAYYYNNSEETYGINGNKYGLLYNSYAVGYMWDNTSELFPTGWRLPRDNEWYTFLMSIGGYSDAGSKLKSTTGWNTLNGNDTYGFNAKPAGYRDSTGIFSGVGTYCLIWQGKEQSYPQPSCALELGDSSSYGQPTNIDKKCCCSVRLVKDIT